MRASAKGTPSRVQSYKPAASGEWLRSNERPPVREVACESPKPNCILRGWIGLSSSVSVSRAADSENSALETHSKFHSEAVPVSSGPAGADPAGAEGAASSGPDGRAGALPTGAAGS